MAFTDLTFLKESTGDNNEVVREMIELFIAQVPEFIANLKKHLRDRNFIELGKEAHKAKSSVMIVGMEELAIDLKHLQLATIDGTEIEHYPEYVHRFEVQMLAAVQELKEILKTL
jgi:HPt (histidine-containing phosphotransfer) domain-containing protein